MLFGGWTLFLWLSPYFRQVGAVLMAACDPPYGASEGASRRRRMAPDGSLIGFAGVHLGGFGVNLAGVSVDLDSFSIILGR